MFLAVHADGQYHTNKFQRSLYKEIGDDISPVDPYFLLSWDVSHWLDLVMVFLREEANSSKFLKRLIKRSNRFHSMFGSGKGHVEYKGLAASLGLKALDTVTFATTRFTSSSYQQWEKIYESYEALVQAFIQNREDQSDENEETKYQVSIS
jgi:hypothetical protein